ncbi:uncharacterized protein METZ01_LOCUS67049, partial [marine metagenome]
FAESSKTWVNVHTAAKAIIAEEE